MPDTLDNTQPTLVLNPVIQITGIYPQHDGFAGYLSDNLGQVHFFASTRTPDSGVAQLNGDLMPLAQNTALFSLLGDYYGGNGQSTFALPDLGGRLVAGTDGNFAQSYGSDTWTLIQDELTGSSGGIQSPIDNHQETQAMGYYINVYGYYPSESSSGGSATIGMVGLFAGNFEPSGALPCDGRLLQIAEYDVLFSVIGTLYGGDGITTFALPDLRDRVPVGAGTVDGVTYSVGDQIGSATTTVGQGNMPSDMGGSGTALDNRAPGLVMTALVATSGLYLNIDETTPSLGEVCWFAGTFAPRYYAEAKGQLLPINQNQALFSLLGVDFGGNGMTSFALPNLVGRTIAGDDDTHLLGDTYGSTTMVLPDTAMPALTINASTGLGTYYGGAQADTFNGHALASAFHGNDGADIVNGGSGVESIWGDGGGDTIVTAGGDDIVDGGAGADKVYGGRGDDSVDGGADNDKIEGGHGNDTLKGGDGADTLVGGTGRDRLYGGAGSDWIVGSDGGDVMTGGLDADTFVLRSVLHSGLGAIAADRITDFAQGSDRIDLSGIDAIAGGDDDAFVFIGTQEFHSVAGEMRYRDDGAGHTIVTIDLDGNAQADLAIWLDGSIALVDTDFVL